MSLNEEQQRIYDAAISGRSLFFTGSAGTGKSFLLKAIIRGLEGRKAAVTAPTGVAAINIGGVTVHKFFDLLPPGVRLPPKRAAKRDRRLAELEVLVIDEISMLGENTFNTICALLDAQRDRPIQYIFCGDFMQLPPVGERMCFMSANWSRVGACACLKTIVRQKDEAFCGILNRARFGEVTAEDLAVLNARREVPGAVELHTHRVDTDQSNLEQLERLPGETTHFRAEDRGKAELLDSCQAPKVLQLRPQARVLLLRNLYREDGLLAHVNGSTGEVLGFGPLRVRFDGGEVQTIDVATFQVMDGKKVVAERKQYPLTLGYATTIHKAQGLTIARVRVRLSSSFATGQAYVALSRATDLAHLALDGHVGRHAFLVDKGAARFMRHVESL